MRLFNSAFTLRKALFVAFVYLENRFRKSEFLFQYIIIELCMKCDIFSTRTRTHLSTKTLGILRILFNTYSVHYAYYTCTMPELCYDISGTLPYLIQYSKLLPCTGTYCTFNNPKNEKTTDAIHFCVAINKYAN